MATEDFRALFARQTENFFARAPGRTVRERARKLRAMKKWIRGNRQRITEAIAQDFGKPRLESYLTEVMLVVKEIDHALFHLKEWTRPVRVGTPLHLFGTRSWIIREPIGVSLIMSPWNFPFMLAVNPMISCLAAGGNAVVKPSENTPHTSALLAGMASDLFDPDEMAVVQGGVETAKALLELPFHHIFFTGSPEVGKKVMAAAARHLASVTLELGGRNPAIVHESANLDTTASRLLFGKFLNAAQSCVAPNYVLVQRKIYDPLVQALRERYEKFSAPGDEPISSIVNEPHFQRLSRLLEEARKAGARPVWEPVLNPSDRTIRPVVLTGVSPDNPILREEIFVPLLPLLPYDDLDEAIHFVNQQPVPLALYLFARSRKAVKHIIRATRAGTTVVNDISVQFAHPGLPFGGVNFSGIGKAHGYHGFLAFTNERALVKQPAGFSAFSWFQPPYRRWKEKLIDWITWKL